MAVTLHIGRFNLDVVATDSGLGIFEWEETHSSRGRLVQMRGIVNTGTQADSDALRTELVNHPQDQPVPITYSLDSNLDGFYLLSDVQFDSSEGSYINAGLYDFRLTALRLGSEADTELQSLLTHALITNDHGLIASEVTFWHGYPPAGNAYDDDGATATILHTRTSEDGEVNVVLDIASAVGQTAPTWSVAPASYYQGAAYVETSGYLRSGTSIPANVPVNWELGNGILRVRPQTFQSTSNGRLNVALWDGAAYTTSFDFKIVRGANVIPGWNYMTIVKNTPEVCVVRLVRDADEGTPSTHIHDLTLTLRRGSMMVYCYYTYTGAANTYTVERNTTDAGTAVTPSGASSAVGIQDSAGTERYVIATAEDHTADTTNGGLDFTSRTTIPFALGVAVPADTHDTASDLMLQYIGWTSEMVRAARR